MSNPTSPPIDKSTWGPGPWMQEEDRIEFRHAGLPCLMLRHPHLGSWCAYVAVPPGHPLWSCDYHDARVDELPAHGGINYSRPCDGDVCHVPKAGEPDNVWWFGFDCAHAFDLAPGMRPIEHELEALGKLEAMPYSLREVYRDAKYVRRVVKRLAEQLAALANQPESRA